MPTCSEWEETKENKAAHVALPLLGSPVPLPGGPPAGDRPDPIPWAPRAKVACVERDGRTRVPERVVL
eukprot:7386660-Prymnesium_polylepis.2